MGYIDNKSSKKTIPDTDETLAQMGRAGRSVEVVLSWQVQASAAEKRLRWVRSVAGPESLHNAVPVAP